MNFVEKVCVRLRHSPVLREQRRLWNTLRPVYDQVLACTARSGIDRLMNGTDAMRILPEYRAISEAYEPETWSRVMSEVREGDVVADVGAFVGLYSIALAKRAGSRGRVVAFEPDPTNFCALETHVALNDLKHVIEARQSAVADHDGMVRFAAARATQSHIGQDAAGGITVQLCCLDTIFQASRVDLIKIDVEGFEEQVIAGAERLLADPTRQPRALFIEVHPYNWHYCGTTSATLISRLHRLGYGVAHLDGAPISIIDSYGEIVARRRNEHF